MLDIKPAHKPIKEYFDELARILSHGHDNEMSVRNAFQDLLQIFPSACSGSSSKNTQ